MEKPSNVYENNRYLAEIVRWLDGDTVEIRIDLGFKVGIHARVRLARIDAPEIKKYSGVTDEEKARGILLTETLNEKIPTGSRVYVSAVKKGKYGRYIVEIWDVDDEGFIYNLNDWLLNEGLVEGVSY